MKPAVLAFTSLNGGRKVMGANADCRRTAGKDRRHAHLILPSPSPLAANHWDIKPWRELAHAVEKLLRLIWQKR